MNYLINPSRLSGFLVVTTCFLACDQFENQDNRSRPSDDESVVPGFEATEDVKVSQGEKKIIEIEGSTAIFEEDTLSADVMIRMENLNELPKAVEDINLGSPKGKILKVSIFDETTKEILSSKVFNQPYTIKQNLTEVTDLSKLKFVVVKSPGRADEKVLIIQAETNTTSSKFALLDLIVSTKMLATNFVIFVVELNENPEDIEVVDSGSEIESTGGGNANSTGNADVPPAYTLTKRQKNLATGNNHVCMITIAGDVKCWGDNFTGQLGVGHADNIGDGPGEMGSDLAKTPLTQDSIEVVAGNNHSCALLEDSSVRCWGFAQKGAIGQENATTIGDQSNEIALLAPIDLGTDFTPVQLSAGAHHSCALSSTGKLKCWGENAYGVLGLGLLANAEVGDSSDEMGDDLPTIDLGVGQKVIQMSSGEYNVCALLEGGKIKCWGRNESGQCGQGHTTDIGANAADMGDALLPIDLGVNSAAVQLDVGQNHTCALLEDGNIKCWGYNSSGALGQGHVNHIGIAENQMGDNLDNVNLGDDIKAKLVFTAGFASCAVILDGTLKCWGSGGILGGGAAGNTGIDSNQMGNNLGSISLGTGRTVINGSGRSAQVCVELDNHEFKCWGTNSQGQLGQGHFNPIEADNPAHMGDNLLPIAFE